MQKLITKYGLAAHLALLAVAPLIVFPFLGIQDTATVVFWLSLLGFVWFLNAPSRINNERSTSEARRRITKALIGDPIFWMFAIITIVSAIRAFNNGITLAYDAENFLWYMTEPAISVLPASSDSFGVPVFASTFLAFVVYFSAKHALGKSARIALTYLVGFLSGIAGLVALYQFVIGNELIGTFARPEISNPGFFGIGFGIVLVMLTAALPASFERHWNVALVTFPIAIGGLIAALFTFSPAYMALGYLTAAIITLVYGTFWAFKKLGKSTALKVVVVFGLSLVVALIAIYGTSFKVVLEKFATLSGGILSAEEADISAKLTAVSMKVWKTNLWLGSGLGTFPQHFRFNATDADWAVVSVGQLSPLNGWSYLLIERGIVGALLWTVPAIGLLWGYVSRIILAKKELPSPMVFSAPIVVIVAFSLNAFNTSLFRIEALPLLVLAATLSTNSWVKEKIDG